MRAMVIDDDPIMLEVMALMLKDIGISYDLFISGKQAILEIEKERYDVVFVDLMMPEISGCDVIATMRSIGVDIPIIILSALSDKDSFKKGIDAGANDFLSKPFSAKDLLLKIQAHFDFHDYKITA